MARIDEGPADPTQLRGALGDGLSQALEFKPTTFQAYTRVVLPVDGYVFWSPTIEICPRGSLHFSQEIQQNVDETVGFATVLFTTQTKITEFENCPTNTIYIGRVGKSRYAFSQQQGFYAQAGTWHYFGHSIYPAMASQLLDNPQSIDPNRAVTSNSLALWLRLNNYKAPFWDGFSNNLTLYPSKLVDPNLVPPYGVIHIPEEGGTRALQAVPHLGRNRTHTQLAADRVRITLYGLQSDEAEDFLDCVIQYMTFWPNDLGLMNMPIVMDGKRAQAELEAIGMQKFIDWEVSYNQRRVADVARQLITSAVPTYLIGDTVIST